MKPQAWIALLLLATLLGCSDPVNGGDADGDVDGDGDSDVDGDVDGDGDADPPVTGFDDLVDWSHAGYPGEIPDVSDTVVDVTEAGARCDGTTDDAAAIQAAIDGAPSPAAVRLPAGTCRIESRLELSAGIVLRGAGSESTTLECESSAGCIAIEGSSGGDGTAIVADAALGSDTLDVADASIFSVGGGAEIQQDDIVPAEADWGANAPGQLVQVVAIEGNTLTVYPPMHIDYTRELNAEISPLRFIEQVGVEDLRLHRVYAGGGDGESNIHIRRAADSWVRRIESDDTEKYHVAASQCLHIEVRDSYFHHARSKGDGGQGYGVSLARHATSVLVENNIFYETRHAMIVQIGVSGTVFGYNYSEANYSDDGWDKPYISLHGHFPFMNLFEGNVFGWVGVGDFWGPVGPGNTFYRNHCLGTDRHETFGPDRGIELEDCHGTQYVVGNMMAQGDIYGDELSCAVVHGNSVGGEVTWDPEFTDHTLPPSYYLSARPAFYGDGAWPSTGSDIPIGEGTMPAWERWTSGAHVPQP